MPKNLFTFECEKLYIGENYGYYINTKVHPEETYYVSTVILIDIERNYIDDYAYEVKVQPVMNLEYCYVTTNNNSICLRYYKNGGFNDSNSCSINLDNNITDAVFPLVQKYSKQDAVGNETHFMHYVESQQFVISDISFASNIQNINSHNYGDSNYSVENDNGYFFNGSTYEYSASKRKKDTYINSIKEIGANIISSAIGYIPIEVIGPTIGLVYDITSNAISAVNSLNAVSTGILYNETNQNYYYPENILPPTRQGQIVKYNNLIKHSHMIINSAPDDRLYFNSGDYAKGTFKISHTTNYDNKKEATNVNINIALKIITTNNDSQQIIANDFSFALNEEETKPIDSIGSINNLYILPGYSQRYQFTPMVNGVYTFNFNNPNISIFVNGELLQNINGEIIKKMYKWQLYNIEIRNTSDSLLKDLFYIDCLDVNKEFVLNAGEELMLKIPNSYENHIILDTNDLDIEFVKLYDNNFNIYKNNINSCEFPCVLSNTDYYVIIKNNEMQSKNVNIINRKAQQINSSTENISIESNDMTNKFIFTATQSKNYQFEIKNDEYYVLIYNSNFAYKSHIVTTLEKIRVYELYLNIGETIYFEITKTNFASSYFNPMILDIRLTDEPLHKWIVNGTIKTDASAYNVTRGDKFSLKLNYREQLFPVLSEYLKNMRLITVQGSEVVVDELARLGTYDIIFIVEKQEVSETLQSERSYKEIYFEINVHIQKEANSAISANQSGDGINININKNIVDQIKVIIKNGEIQRTYMLNGSTNYVNGFDKNYPMLSIGIVSIWYKLKTDATGNEITNAEVKNNKYGVDISNINTSHMFGGQEGTLYSPYYIYNITQFNNIKDVASKGYYFSQISNLDFGNLLPETAFSDFIGFYNGNNYNINISYEGNKSGNFGGLFRTLYGNLINIVLKLNIKLNSGSSLGFGGAVSYNRGTIDNIKVSGKINSNTPLGSIGGIVSVNYESILNCKADLTLYSMQLVGGIVALNLNIVKNCTYQGYIFCNFNVDSDPDCYGGGIVAINYGNIENCITIGFIKYSGEKTNSRTFNPGIGSIAGKSSSSSLLKNTAGMAVDSGKLTTITWKEYKFPRWVENSHNQAMYVGKDIGQKI